MSDSGGVPLAKAKHSLGPIVTRKHENYKGNKEDRKILSKAIKWQLDKENN